MRRGVGIPTMPNRSRLNSPIAALRLAPGVMAVWQGRAVRITAVRSLSEIQFCVLGTAEYVWSSAEELSAPVAELKPKALVHPQDADPLLEREAMAWHDALGTLPLRVSTSQIEVVAARMGVDRRTVLRRRALYLADPSPNSQLRALPGPAPGSRRLPPAVEAVINQAIHDIYLTRQRCPVSVVLLHVRMLCEQSGLEPVSRKAVEARIRALDPMFAARKRLGPELALAVQAPSVKGVTTHRALQLVQIDHAVIDLVVVSPDTRLPIGRPWITLAIDVHTRCVVGYYLSMDEPTQTSVALCLAHACLPKDAWLRRWDLKGDYPIFGKFEAVSWDNARTFRTQGIEAQCQRYGIEVVLRPVRKPHYGAYIERLIGTLMGKIHLLPGTTFSNPQQRKDYDSERHAVMTLTDLAKWIGHEIVDVYHHTPHRGLGGLTPRAKWDVAWTQADGTVTLPPLIADPRHFMVGLLPREERSVTREGISLHGLRYWDPAIAQLINNKQRYYVHFNHGDLTKIYLHYQGDYIDVPLIDRTRSPFTWDELKEAKRALAKTGAPRAKEAVVFAAITEQRQIQDKAAATSKRARLKKARRPETPSVTPKSAPVDYTLPLKPLNLDEANDL